MLFPDACVTNSVTVTHNDDVSLCREDGRLVVHAGNLCLGPCHLVPLSLWLLRPVDPESAAAVAKYTMWQHVLSYTDTLSSQPVSLTGMML